MSKRVKRGVGAVVLTAWIVVVVALYAALMWMFGQFAGAGR